MRTFGVALLIASLACTLARSAPPATNAAIASVSGSLDVAGRHITLPAGSWLIVGASHDSAGPEETRPYGTIETFVLFKLAGNVVEDFITIRANSLPVTGSWGPAVECDRKDIDFVTVFYRAAPENFCGFVNHVVNGRDAASSPAWTAALELAAWHGWQMPATWLMAGFRIANRHDVLDLRYHVNPEPAGFPRDEGSWTASAWAPARVDADARRKAAIEHMARWVMESSASIQRIAAGQVDSGIVLVLPTISAAPSKGEVEATAAPESVWKRAAIKTGTYRVLSSTTTIVTALPFTTGIAEAGLYAVFLAATHSSLFFLHELAWETFGIAKPRPALEFPGAGISR